MAGSVYYSAYAFNQVDFANIDMIWSAVFACIVVSIVLHGVAVTPVTRWLDGETPFPWQRQETPADQASALIPPR